MSQAVPLPAAAQAWVEALEQLGAPAALAAARAGRDALVGRPRPGQPLLLQSAPGPVPGPPRQAARMLERALSLPLSTAERAGALVELGDTWLEAGQIAAAQARFAEVADLEGVEDPTRFAAAMGRAEALHAARGICPAPWMRSPSSIPPIPAAAAGGWRPGRACRWRRAMPKPRWSPGWP